MMYGATKYIWRSYISRPLRCKVNNYYVAEPPHLLRRAFALLWASPITCLFPRYQEAMGVA